MSDYRRTHVVISAPSQWGQQACDHLLHRAVAFGGRVTLIVPRRDKERFEKKPPSIKEWQHHPSLKDCLEHLRTSGRPIDYLYDDQTNHLAATLISQRESGSHLTVGYVTSSADDHLNHADYLSCFCERVLVEKPVSRIFSEIQPGGGFAKLVRQAAGQKCQLTTAEHYLFRPGVTSALDLLEEFFQRHRHCDLCYDFHFTERADRDNPAERLSSYQDGSILDVLATHGLGPVARLLVPKLGLSAEVDFDEHLTWHLVRSWQAIEANGSLKVPVLAETAAELRGRLRLPGSQQTIHVCLRSAKGFRTGLRYFKFFCPKTNCQSFGEKWGQVRSDRGTRSGVADECLYFGVSLGSAGFTVSDYSNPSDQLFEERDGGYQSDTLGINSEAANAQAAMLDALLSDKLELGRFVPIDTACQLVRTGIRAQGQAFNRKPGEYVWGTQPDDWDASGNEDSVDVTPKSLGHLTVGIPQLEEIFDLAQQKPAASEPYHRVVTILGAEGAGNSDVARALSKEIPATLLINIPRDEAWERQQPESSSADAPSPSKFTLETVLRDLATQLKLPMTTARRPSEELLAYLRRAGKHLSGEGILLFNGVDRLPSPDWHVLVRILNHLPQKYRMIFVTKKWDRAAGFVIKTDELIKALSSSEIERLKSPPLEEYFPPALQQDEEISNRYRRLWKEILLPFSKSNVTVQQQIASYIFYIALPAALQKRGIQGRQDAWWDVDPQNLKWSDLSEHVREEIASLDLPTPLVAYPEAFLDRVSLLCLAMVGEDDRSAIRSLSAFSGPIRRELIEEVRPGLFARLNQFQPVRALFEKVEEEKAFLFPRVRRAALTCQAEQLAQLRAEVERRRLILALRRLYSSSPDRQQLEEMIRLLYGASLESLNLDQSPFETCCMELIAGLETSSDLHGDQAAGSLIELLIDDSSFRKTNLGLLARARLTRLKGWLLCSAAGTEPALLHHATEVLIHAHALAQDCVRRTEKERPDSQEPGGPQEQEDRETLILTIQGVVFAGLVQNRCWHRLLGVGTISWVEKPEWEKFVTPDQARNEHSLWRLCGLDPRGEQKEPVDVSKNVLAAAVRLLALYTAVRHPRGAPNRPARLCLIAAELNEGKEDRRARDLLEAALILQDEPPIDDCWNLTQSGERLTRSVLYTKAREIFTRERATHLGLAPYMDLLGRIVEERIHGGSLLTLDELTHFEVEFERTGEVYFTELVQQMKESRQKTE